MLASVHVGVGTVPIMRACWTFLQLCFTLLTYSNLGPTNNTNQPPWATDSAHPTCAATLNRGRASKYIFAPDAEEMCDTKRKSQIHNDRCTLFGMAFITKCAGNSTDGFSQNPLFVLCCACAMLFWTVVTPCVSACGFLRHCRVGCGHATDSTPEGKGTKEIYMRCLHETQTADTNC